MEDPYVFPNDIVKYLGVSRVAVHYARMNGHIPKGIKIGRTVYWKRDDVWPYVIAWKKRLDNNVDMNGKQTSRGRRGRS